VNPPRPCWSLEGFHNLYPSDREAEVTGGFSGARAGLLVIMPVAIEKLREKIRMRHDALQTIVFDQPHARSRPYPNVAVDVFKEFRLVPEISENGVGL
jgi:hypothetical protein